MVSHNSELYCSVVWQEHTADLKQRIEAQFSDLHQFLYQEEKMLQVKLKTEERRELIRLDEHKALLCVEISRLRRAFSEIEEKLREHEPYTLLRVSLYMVLATMMNNANHLKFNVANIQSLIISHLMILISHIMLTQ